MAPKGLNIGDTFEEVDFYGVFRHKITGFDAQGNYLSECIGRVDKKPEVVEEEPEEKTPIEEMLSAPAEEKPKTTKPRTTTTRKRKTSTKKK